MGLLWIAFILLSLLTFSFPLSLHNDIILWYIPDIHKIIKTGGHMEIQQNCFYRHPTSSILLISETETDPYFSRQWSYIINDYACMFFSSYLFFTQVIVADTQPCLYQPWTSPKYQCQITMLVYQPFITPTQQSGNYHSIQIHIMFLSTYTNMVVSRALMKTRPTNV